VCVHGDDKARKPPGRPHRSLFALLYERELGVGVEMSSGEGSSDRGFRKKDPSGAMDGYRIAYKPLADSTPQDELTALAAVYRFLLLHRQETSEESVADPEGSDVRAE